MTQIREACRCGAMYRTILSQIAHCTSGKAKGSMGDADYKKWEWFLGIKKVKHCHNCLSKCYHSTRWCRGRKELTNEELIQGSINSMARQYPWVDICPLDELDAAMEETLRLNPHLRGMR